MKKFTLLVTALLCTAALSAQDAKLQLTEVWNKSVGATEVADELDPKQGTRPDFLGTADGNERSMACYDGKLYIPSRAFSEDTGEKDDAGKPIMKTINQIVVLDAANGNWNKADNIITPDEIVTEGIFVINSIAIDEDGMMVVSNMTQNGTLKLYTYNLENPSEGWKVLLNYKDKQEYIDIIADETKTDAEKEAAKSKIIGALRLGTNNIGMTGTIAGDAIMVFPTQGANKALKVVVKNGKVAEDGTTVITLEGIKEDNIGTSPLAFGVTDNDFIVDGHNTVPMRYTYDGKLAETLKPVMVEEIEYPHTGISSGVTFTFNNQEYLFTSCVNIDGAPVGAAGGVGAGVYELLKVPAEGLTAVEHVGFACTPGVGLAGTMPLVRQTSFVAPVCVDVQKDAAYLYMMYPGSGVAAYKLSDGTSSIDAKQANAAISVYPNPATDVLNIAGEVTTVELYTIAGQKVMEVANENVINVAGLQGMYLVKVTDNAGKVTTVKVSVK